MKARWNQSILTRWKLGLIQGFRIKLFRFFLHGLRPIGLRVHIINLRRFLRFFRQCKVFIQFGCIFRPRHLTKIKSKDPRYFLIQVPPSSQRMLMRWSSQNTQRLSWSNRGYYRLRTPIWEESSIPSTIQAVKAIFLFPAPRNYPKVYYQPML